MLSVLFMDVFVPKVKLVVTDYYVMTIVLAVLLVLVWRIWKYLKLYAEFPTFPLMRFIVCTIVMNRIPKHLPIGAYFIKEIPRLLKRYEKEELCLTWLPEPFIFILSKNVVKAFMNEKDLIEKADKYALLRDVFGTGLITSDGDTWRKHRKLLNPVFHVGMLKNKIPIFNKNADILVKKLEKEAMNETSIDVLELLQLCSFTVLFEYIFGLNMDISKNEEVIKSYMKEVKIGSELLAERLMIPWTHFKFMWKFFPSGRRYSKYIDVQNNFTKEILSKMREQIISRQADSAVGDDDWTTVEDSRKSFAHILLDHHLKDNSFTLEDIQSQVTTFTLAGFETVANGLMWTLFLLGHDPDVQDQAYNEAISLSETDINYEDLHKLKYLECVIKEAFRLYPPVPFYAKQLTKDMQYGKYNVPKGTTIGFFSYVLHRNPEVFPDPEKFDPDRFQEGNAPIRPEKYMPFANGIRNCIDFFKEAVRLAQQYQKEKFLLVWVPEPCVFVFSEEAAKVFMNEKDLIEKPYKYALLRDIFGTGLITSDGDTWRKHRKLLNPVFHVGMLKNKIPIFNKNADILVKKLEKEAMNETSIDVLELLRICSIGILFEYIFGLNMDISKNEEVIKSYIKEVKLGFEFIAERLIKPWMYFKFMWKFSPSGRRYAKYIDVQNNFTKEILSKMREQIISRQADSAVEDDDWTTVEDSRKSFAHILLDQHLKYNSFTLEDIQSQVTTFTLAGFETVANGLMWILFLLGHHPDVQDQAYNEAISLSETDINYEDLHKLKYLECVIKETFRLYPPVPFYAKKLTKDMQYGKYNVPKGTTIAFFVYILHRNPEVFPDPEKFDPDRFQEGNALIRPENYMPFANGIRNCIGKGFAMIETKVILACILRKFRITSLEERKDVDLIYGIALRSVRPLRLRFTPRK